MPKFRKPHGNQGGGHGRDRFGGRRGGRQGFDGGHREMFPATCANCGKACQVPFRPSGEKPVYCNDCFGNPKLHGGGNAPRDFGNEQAATSRAPEKDTRIDDLKRQVDAMQSKLDKVLQILEASARPQPLAQPTEVPMRTTKAKKQGVTPKKVAKKRK